jgi:putative Holliday junction resolvase
MSLAAPMPVSPQVPARCQRFLAFDYGLKRTGVASGNRLTATATPQATIKAEGDARLVQIAARIQ